MIKNDVGSARIVDSYANNKDNGLKWFGPKEYDDKVEESVAALGITCGEEEWRKIRSKRHILFIKCYT